MKKDKAKDSSLVTFTEQTPELQIGEPERSENYKKAFPENGAGASNENNPNTAPWD